ncbi:hypothetical protein PVAP13_8KG048300 [Panicum virgatum]|uniref:RING-type domain-containing protein n=2 Tax=Panicum virgatum TaxID=38727 RepID=A0A8T0PDD4_PANVG|nr:hypothetical protein PVAP13_8KG048300 [Panicum virgatum]
MEEAWEIGESEAQGGGGGESPAFVFEQATFVLGGRTYTARMRHFQRSAPAAATPDDDEHLIPSVFRPASSSSPPQAHAAAAPGSSLTTNKRARAPASSKAILGLREVTAPPTGSSDCCAICLQDLQAHQGPAAAEPTTLSLRVMPCSHTFHQRCIFEWLRRNAVCPLCRHQLPTEEEDEQQDQEQDQGRRSRSRVVYNEDGQHHILWHYTEQPVAGEVPELDEE